MEYRAGESCPLSTSFISVSYRTYPSPPTWWGTTNNAINAPAERNPHSMRAVSEAGSLFVVVIVADAEAQRLFGGLHDRFGIALAEDDRTRGGGSGTRLRFRIDAVE